MTIWVAVFSKVGVPEMLVICDNELWTTLEQIFEGDSGSLTCVVYALLWCLMSLWREWHPPVFIIILSSWP